MQGGKRPGAGRPTGGRRNAKKAKRKEYATAHDYLQAVACGLESSDDLARISAAKALLPFETPKTRVRKASPAPRDIRRSADAEADAAQREAWAKRSAEVRARLGRN